MSRKMKSSLQRAFVALALLSIPSAGLAAETCGERQSLYGQEDGVAPGSGVYFQGTPPPQEPDARDSQAADDFRVPVGEVWSVETVRVEAFATPPPALPPGGVNVAFHLDDGGKPGDVICAYASVIPEVLDATDPEGVQHLSLPLPSACTLCADTGYWLSIQALGPQALVYHWRQRTARNLAPAVWRNPG